MLYCVVSSKMNTIQHNNTTRRSLHLHVYYHNNFRNRFGRAFFFLKVLSVVFPVVLYNMCSISPFMQQQLSYLTNFVGVAIFQLDPTDPVPWASDISLLFDREFSTEFTIYAEHFFKRKTGNTNIVRLHNRRPKTLCNLPIDKRVFSML